MQRRIGMQQAIWRQSAHEVLDGDGHCRAGGWRECGRPSAGTFSRFSAFPAGVLAYFPGAHADFSRARAHADFSNERH